MNGIFINKKLNYDFKNGHFPYYSDSELKEILKDYDPLKDENTDEVRGILKKIRGKNGHERRKLCIQSLSKKEKMPSFTIFTVNQFSLVKKTLLNIISLTIISATSFAENRKYQYLVISKPKKR